MPIDLTKKSDIPINCQSQYLPKYCVGDTVWIMPAREPIEMKIHKLHITHLGERWNPEIKYYAPGIGWVEEPECYQTREGLIQDLKQKLDRL